MWPWTSRKSRLPWTIQMVCSDRQRGRWARRSRRRGAPGHDLPPSLQEPQKCRGGGSFFINCFFFSVSEGVNRRCEQEKERERRKEKQTYKRGRKKNARETERTVGGKVRHPSYWLWESETEPPPPPPPSPPNIGNITFMNPCSWKQPQAPPRDVSSPLLSLPHWSKGHHFLSQAPFCLDERVWKSPPCDVTRGC